MAQECHHPRILNTEFTMPKKIGQEVLEEAVKQKFPGATVQRRTLHVWSDPQENPGVRNKQPDENVYWIETPYTGTLQEATTAINSFLKEFAESRGHYFHLSVRDPR